MSGHEREDRRETDRGGFITIKAVHVWGPFVLQLAMLIGGYYRLEQKVDDMNARLDRVETQIMELRAHVWK